MSANQLATKPSDLAEQLAKANLRTKAITGLERCLFAEDEYYDAIRKQVVVKTDFKTVLGAVLGILAYTDGKPVERKEILTRTTTTLEELQAKVKNSPELRKAIEELLTDDAKPVLSSKT